jgi:hypothetical protein
MSLLKMRFLLKRFTYIFLETFRLNAIKVNELYMTKIEY